MLILFEQGAGETLRGTFNSTIDRRFQAPPETLQNHNNIINSGRAEIESGRFSDVTRENERAGKIGGVLRKVMQPSGDQQPRLRVVNE